jgi:hypothetical protein
MSDPTSEPHDHHEQEPVMTARHVRSTVIAGVLALLAALVVALPSATPATAATPLTNLAHLDFLQADVSPPPQDGHTTYRLAEEPSIGVLWTYADRQGDGTYKRVGGGA